MFLKRYRTVRVSALLLIAALAIISFHLDEKRDIGFFEKIVLEAASPFQWVVVKSSDAIESLVNSYLFLVNVKRENEELKAKLKAWPALQTQVEELHAANERLRKLLQFKQSFLTETIPAEVIGEDASYWFKTILLNKGTRHGVKKGLAVVTSEGIVGKIVDCSYSVSKVLLAVDRNSAIDALIQRSRARGIVEGVNHSTCQLKYVPRTADIALKDKIVSSGLGGIYSKGLLIGTVNRIVKKDYGLFQYVEIEPSVDFSKLEEVLIVLKKEH